jgi:hypothetical protein
MSPPLYSSYKVCFLTQVKFALHRVLDTFSGGLFSTWKASIATFSWFGILLILCTLLLFLSPVLLSLISMNVYFVCSALGLHLMLVFLELVANVYADNGFAVTFNSFSGLEDNEIYDYSISGAVKTIFRNWDSVHSTAFNLIRELIKATIATAYLSIIIYLKVLPGASMTTFSCLLGNISMFGFVFCWIPVCQSHYALICSKPPEPNTFHSEDPYMLDRFSRMICMCILVAVAAILQAIPTDFYETAQTALFTVWVSMPLLWTLGVLPSFRILVVAAMEISTSTILGVTPFLSTARAIAGILVYGLFLACIILVSSLDVKACVYIASIGSVLLSSGFWVDFIAKRYPRSLKQPLYDRICRTIKFRKVTIPLSLIHITLRSIIVCCIAIYVFFNTVSEVGASVIYTIFTFLCVLLLSRQAHFIYLPSVFPLFFNPVNNCKKNNRSLKILHLLHYAAYQSLPYVLQYVAILSSVFEVEALNIWTSAMILRTNISCWFNPENMAIDIILQFVFQNYGKWAVTKIISFQTQLLLINIARHIIYRFLKRTFVWMVMVKHFVVNTCNLVLSQREA